MTAAAAAPETGSARPDAAGQAALPPLPSGPALSAELSSGPAARLELARQLTIGLRQAIDLVGIDEFYSQETQFDQDSRLGRELLYLIANDEWSRATREIITLDASDSVPTSIQVHVDLGRITHEAFRNRLERVWLPLAVLPPPVTDADGRRAGPGPRIAPSPTVRDRSGNVLPSLPQSEARRWMAAAMAEIILNITPAAMGAQHSIGQLAREQRLLLSAAIYRVLRQGSDHAAGPRPDSHVDDGYRRGRIQEARGDLGALMDAVIERLQAPGGPDRSTLLIRRAARVLHAVSSPTTLVVVSVEPEAESAVFFVGVPARPLTGRRQPLSAPRAEIHLNVLLPSVDADRAIVVNLPEGLSFSRPGRRPFLDWLSRMPVTRHWVRSEDDIAQARADDDPQPVRWKFWQRHPGQPDAQALLRLFRRDSEPSKVPWPGRRAPVRARIAMDRPRILWQIDELLRQLDPDGPDRPDPVARCLVDFTLSRMDNAQDAYRQYRPTQQEAENNLRTADLVPGWDRQLHTDLQQIRADPRPGAAAAATTAATVRGPARTAREAVRRGRHTSAGLLFRTHEGDTVSPRRAHIRIPAVENRNVRATPVEAAVRLEIVADDSTPLRAARHSGFLSLLLLSIVLLTTLWRHTDVDEQVLASVLTLFAAIQAGRIQSPDRSTLRGLLISGGSWVIVASVLPPVMLGVVLAFKPYPKWIYAAALAGQVVLQLIMYSPPLTGRSWSRSTRPSLLLASDRAAPDHPRIDVLHSSWWRSTTAAALLLGANAHGFVLPQTTGGVGELLGGDEPATAPIPRNPNLAQRVRNVRRRIAVPLDEPVSEQLTTFTAAVPKTPANILAMLRAGTTDRSLTFLVFREEPQEEWQSRARAKVELDVDRLIAHEAPIGNLEVFIGLPADGLQPIAAHPLRHLLRLAQDRQLLILDAQFPVPPPLGAGPGRSWTKTRIGLRGDEIADLAGLLTDILQIVRANGDPDVDLLVDTSTQTPPRRFLGTPAPADPGAIAVAMRPSALNVIPRVDSAPGTRDWLTVAMCDYARSGAEAQILSSLTQRHPDLELAGLTVAVLHGTCIVFALGHQPGVPAGRSGSTTATSLPRDAQLLVEDWTTAAELGELPDEGLLLQVHAQYSDRPGLFSALVDELGHGLAAAVGPDYPADELRLSYVHTEVADGRNATTWFTVGLPPPATFAQFDRLVLDRVERAGRRVLAAPASDDPAADNLGLLRDARAMVSVEVVTVQPGSAGNAGSADRADRASRPASADVRRVDLDPDRTGLPAG